MIKTKSRINSTLLIKIRKLRINRGSKSNYSWILNSESKEIINLPFILLARIIMIICSNDVWLALISNITINHHKFCAFLLKLNKWLKKVNYLEVMKLY